MIGDSGVGKTCLMMRFADDHFTDTHISTIGVDFRMRTVRVDGHLVKLQIWDTAGQERFRTITSAYYRGADGIVMVYDVTREESFDHIHEWLGEVDRYSRPNISKLLIGNKADLCRDTVISHDQGAFLATSLSARFIETSAKTATNVNSAFLLIAKQLTNGTHLSWDGEDPSGPPKDQCAGAVVTLCGEGDTATRNSGSAGSCCA